MASLIAESKTETTNISSEINGKKQKRRRRKNYKNKRLETIESTSLEDLNKEEKTTPLSDDKNLANIDQLKKRTNFIEKANIDPARVNHTNNPRNNKNTSDKISSIRNKKKVAGRSASIEKDERFHNAKLENPEVLNQKTTNPNTKKEW